VKNTSIVDSKNTLKNKSLIINSEFGKLKIPVDLVDRDYLELTTKNPYKLYHNFA
jgi:hypothetical protein